MYGKAIVEEIVGGCRNGFAIGVHPLTSTVVVLFKVGGPYCLPAHAQTRKYVEVEPPHFSHRKQLENVYSENPNPTDTNRH